MDRKSQLLLTAVIALVGAVLLFALAVYPYQYGLVESTVLVGLLVGVAIFETVLDETRI